jgi:hypothetical protein
MFDNAPAGAPKKLICVVLGASSESGRGDTCRPLPGNTSEMLR